MAKIIVDGIELDVPADYTLFQACEEARSEVPRFCFHERLSIAGNCRMCLVEVKGAPKPVASCAMAIKDLRPGPNGEPPEVFTKTPSIKKARQGVMEFLLINHPLDCPICDQGGECDLQDQAMAYGTDTSRYHENKRAVEDKYMGPLVKTSMNRCIHCTRCVRFLTEVSGVSELGAIGRGEDMEITTYLEQALSSELQGNVIDLCPVGALTSKPYEFKARPWELTKTETIDVMDAVGSAIRVDSRGREVMRVMPRLNEDINEEWLADKSRFIWDGLKSQRLDRPYIRENGRLRPASWAEAFAAVAAKVKATSPERMGAIAGDLASVEEVYALKDLMTQLGVSNLDCRQDGALLDPALGRASYLFNAGISGIDEADAILIIGANPRSEAPVLNARIRKRWRNSGVKVALIGQSADLTYPVDYLGSGSETVADVLSGSHPFADVLKNAEKPLVIVGQGALMHADAAKLLSHAAQIVALSDKIAEGWNGLAVLHTAAARVGALDLGFVPAKGGKTAAELTAEEGADVLFLLGADEIDVAQGAFVVYLGTHGDRGAHRADVILPGATYTEKSGLYANTEGRVQLALRSNFPPGDAREDWAILRALSEALGVTLGYDSLNALREKLFAEFPHFAALDVLQKNDAQSLGALARLKGKVKKVSFTHAIADYYLTNPIARASKVMAECSALASRSKAPVAAE